MGRMVDVDDLVTASQIADRLGLAHSETVYSWVARYPEFPDPAWRVKRARLWLWSEVREWAVSTHRLPAGS